MKHTIRLKESELKRMISESVKKVLIEIERSNPNDKNFINENINPTAGMRPLGRYESERMRKSIQQEREEYEENEKKYKAAIEDFKKQVGNYKNDQKWLANKIAKKYNIEYPLALEYRLLDLGIMDKRAF